MPLVCASLHGPSSRLAMAAAAMAYELEQEAGRAPPPQIQSRPARAAPERGRAGSRPSSECRRHGPAPRRNEGGEGRSAGCARAPLVKSSMVEALGSAGGGGGGGAIGGVEMQAGGAGAHVAL